jgi:hypothetical protein
MGILSHGFGRFRDLTDVPNSYSGQAGKVVAVNATATGLEFVTSGGSPGGSNTQVQFNNSGAFGGSASFTWDGSQLAVIKQTITSPSTVTVPLTIVGASGQTANLLEVQNSSGALRFSVEANGTIKAPINVGAGNAFWFYNQDLLMQATLAQLSAPGACYVFADNGGSSLRQIKAHSIFLTGSNADVLTTFTRLAAVSGSTTQMCGIFRSAASSSVNNTEWQDSTGANMCAISAAGKMSFDTTITAGGTTGARTINKPSGTVNFAAAATSLVVTNSLVSTSSIILCVVRTNDTTATIKNVVPAAGSFTINLGAAATAETSVGFIVFN